MPANHQDPRTTTADWPGLVRELLLDPRALLDATAGPGAESADPAEGFTAAVNGVALAPEVTAARPVQDEPLAASSVALAAALAAALPEPPPLAGLDDPARGNAIEALISPVLAGEELMASVASAPADLTAQALTGLEDFAPEPGPAWPAVPGFDGTDQPATRPPLDPLAESELGPFNGGGFSLGDLALDDRPAASPAADGFPQSFADGSPPRTDQRSSTDRWGESSGGGGESLGLVATRLTQAADRLEQAADRLRPAAGTVAPPPRPFRGRVDG